MSQIKISNPSEKKQEEDNKTNCEIIPPANIGHPQFFPEVLKEPPQFDVLEKLVGTWVNTEKTNSGIHTTCLPSPGTNSEQIPGKFHFKSENYTETLKFEKVPDKVRNRGGANEQLIAALKYDQSIISEETGDGIHEENGMFMWLGDMYNHPASNDSVTEDLGLPELTPGDGAKGPVFVPSHTIARSGTIPHGNSILLIGRPTKNILGPPKFPTGIDTWDFDHLAISPTMGGAGSEPIDLDGQLPPWVVDTTLPYKDPSGNRTYTQRILSHKLFPYSTRPDLRLRDTIKDQKINSHDMIVLDTEFDHGQGPQGGVTSTPMVDKFTPVSKITFRMWIEEVEEEDGTKVEQLQYEQVMFFKFGFGTNGGTTFWPHIQVNTLRRKKEEVTGEDLCAQSR